MFKGVLICLIISLLTLNSNVFGDRDDLSPDSLKLYHEIGSGRGLYTVNDKVKILNGTNFNKTIYDENGITGQGWIIEFYNSWCGHCHRFAPIWKQFAQDVYGWKNIIGVGVLDCANDLNTELCRDYEILFYPQIKYFPVGSPMTFLGTVIKQGSMRSMRNDLTSLFWNEYEQNLVDKPRLYFYEGNDFNGLWGNTPKNILYTLLVIENDDSRLGIELAMDLIDNDKIQVWRCKSNNKALISAVQANEFPSVFLIGRDNIVESFHEVKDKSHLDIYHYLRDRMRNKGITIPQIKVEVVLDEMIDTNLIYSIRRAMNFIKNKLDKNLNDVVFQVDIEEALKHSLINEISLHKLITGQAYTALQEYISVLVDSFPIGKQGKLFLQRIQLHLKKKQEVTGADFQNLVKESQNGLDEPFLISNGWIGCRGSSSQFRGYPCGLWQLFHTLTVNTRQFDHPKHVLIVMRNYISNFFGCSDCANHFLQMSQSIDTNVTTVDDAILWLWSAHNFVNNRLKNDASVDPKYPKIQFPSNVSCENCQTDLKTWDKTQVLLFLKNMYGNISYITLNDLPSQLPTNVDAIILNKDGDTKPFLQFSQLDINMLAFFYVLSITLVIVVSIKLCIKKNGKVKKKPYGFDYMNKV